MKHFFPANVLHFFIEHLDIHSS